MKCGRQPLFAVDPPARVGKLLVGKTTERLCKETLLDFFFLVQGIKPVTLLVQDGVNAPLPTSQLLLLVLLLLVLLLLLLLEYPGLTFDLPTLVRGHFMGRLCTAVAADPLGLSAVSKFRTKLGRVSLLMAVLALLAQKSRANHDTIRSWFVLHEVRCVLRLRLSSGLAARAEGRIGRRHICYSSL